MLDALAKAHREKWGTQEVLLETIATQVNLLWRQYVIQHQKPGAEPPKPLEINRPGQQRAKRKGSGLASLARGLTASRR